VVVFGHVAVFLLYTKEFPFHGVGVGNRALVHLLNSNFHSGNDYGWTKGLNIVYISLFRQPHTAIYSLHGSPFDAVHLDTHVRLLAADEESLLDCSC
jgi:hypothetical protein